MKSLSNLSIRDKLVGIILVSTILSMVAGFTLVITWTFKTFEEQLLFSTKAITNVLGTYAAFYLIFKDDDPAEMLEQATTELNQSLEVHPWISDAILFDRDGEVFTRYTRDDPLPPPEIPEQDEAYIDEDEGYAHAFVSLFFRDDGEDRDVGTLYLRGTKEKLDQDLRDFLIYMGLLTVAMVGAAVVLAYLLQGFISKPILHLAEQAQRISSDADYSVRVDKPGNDEIGILYDGFNNMLEQIQKRQEDLERSNRDLDQFAYVASHDLKAPLRAIATLSGWIEEDLRDKLSEEASEQMALLRSRVQRMDQLIDGILQYSRAGRLDSRGERVDVGEMLRDLIELLSPPESFKVVADTDMPVMVTKRLRLEQVFSNLINNAIKYHDRLDGRVDVTAHRQGRFYEFSVADDGPGIAEEHHQKVFMMFQTLQPRDQVESTGLGLSLVKKLVEEEGGSIHLESKPGAGATFRFTWPAEDVGEAPEDVQS